MTWKCVVAVAVGVVALAFSEAFAQYDASNIYKIYKNDYTNIYNGTRWNNPISAFLDVQLMNKTFADSLRRQPATKRPDGTRIEPPDQKRAGPAGDKALPDRRPSRVQGSPAAALTFRADVKASMVGPIASQFGDSDEQRRALRQAFRQFLAHFNAEAHRDRMPHDVSRAAAAFIVVSYMVATGEEIQDPAADNLRHQLAASLPANPQYLTLSDFQKQQLYETLVILGTFVGVGYDNGKEARNREQMNAFRRLSRNWLEALLGMPLNRMTFTRTAFEIH